MRTDTSTEDLLESVLDNVKELHVDPTKIGNALHSAWMRGFREGCRHIRSNHLRAPETLEEARDLFGDSLLMNLVSMHLENFAPPEPSDD